MFFYGIIVIKLKIKLKIIGITRLQPIDTKRNAKRVKALIQKPKGRLLKKSQPAFFKSCNGKATALMVKGKGLREKDKS